MSIDMRSSRGCVDLAVVGERYRRTVVHARRRRRDPKSASASCNWCTCPAAPGMRFIWSVMRRMSPAVPSRDLLPLVVAVVEVDRHAYWLNASVLKFCRQHFMISASSSREELGLKVISVTRTPPMPLDIDEGDFRAGSRPSRGLLYVYPSGDRGPSWSCLTLFTETLPNSAPSL